MSDSGGGEVPAGPWPTPLTLRVLIDGPDHHGNSETVRLLAAVYESSVVPVLDAQNRPVAQWTNFEAVGPAGQPMQCDVVVGLPDLSNAGRQSLARASDAVVLGLDTTAEGMEAAARLLRSESIRGASHRLVIVGRRHGADDGITATSLLAALGQEANTPAVVTGTSQVDMSEGFTLAVTVGLDRLRWMGSAASSRRSFSTALLTTMVRAGSAGTPSSGRPVFASGTSAAIPTGQAPARQRPTEPTANEPQPTGPLPITEITTSEPTANEPTASGTEGTNRTESLFTTMNGPADVGQAGSKLFLMPTAPVPSTAGVEPSGRLFAGPAEESRPAGEPAAVFSEPTGPIAVTLSSEIDETAIERSHPLPVATPAPDASPEPSPGVAELVEPPVGAEPTGPLPVTGPVGRDAQAGRRRRIGRRGGDHPRRAADPAPTADIAPIAAPVPAWADPSNRTRPLFERDLSEPASARRSRLFDSGDEEPWPWTDPVDPEGPGDADQDRPVLVPAGALTAGSEHDGLEPLLPAAEPARVTTEARALEFAFAHRLPTDEAPHPAPAASPEPDRPHHQRPEDDPFLAELLERSARGKPILASGVMIALLLTTTLMVLGLMLNA